MFLPYSRFGNKVGLERSITRLSLPLLRGVLPLRCARMMGAALPAGEWEYSALKQCRIFPMQSIVPEESQVSL